MHPGSSRPDYATESVLLADPLVTWRHAMLYSRAVVAMDAKGGLPQEVLRNFHHKIGVIAASAYVDFGRRNFPLAKIVELKGWDDVLAALKDGKVDAIYRDEFESRKRPMLHESASCLACPRAAYKAGTCRSSRSKNWQHWCRRQSFFHIAVAAGSRNLRGRADSVQTPEETHHEPS
jgi:hypothetical protein